MIDLWVETNKGSDPSTLDQCVDLWRAYNRKVIQAPDIFGNPPDLWDKYQTDYYERIPNTPDGVPQLGDVIIWGTKYGKYGHIAVCTEIADKSSFTSFDQNDPIGESCHFQPHTYSGVLGWLRPKNQSVINPPEGSNDADKISDLEDKVKSLNEALATTQLENNQLRTSLENQERDNKDLTSQILEARNQRDQAIREKEILSGENKSLQERLDSALAEATRLSEALVAAGALAISSLSASMILRAYFRKIFGK
jgi:regulator of replication initiation timing